MITPTVTAEMLETLIHVEKMFAQMPNLNTGYIGVKVSAVLDAALPGTTPGNRQDLS